jgi:hypothetical protein
LGMLGGDLARERAGRVQHSCLVLKGTKVGVGVETAAGYSTL